MEKYQLFGKLQELESQINELHDQIKMHEKQIEIDYKKIKNLETEMIKQGQPIIRHSEFKNFFIGPILAELVTTISEREFIYSNVKVWTGTYPYDLEYKNVIVHKTKYQEFYRINELNKLISEGEAISIYEVEPYTVNTPNFFEMRGCNIYLNVNAISFNQEKFPFVVDFLKMLVENCCKKNDSFPENRIINESMKEFLDNYKINHKTENKALTKNK